MTDDARRSSAEVSEQTTVLAKNMVTPIAVRPEQRIMVIGEDDDVRSGQGHVAALDRVSQIK